MCKLNIFRIGLMLCSLLMCSINAPVMAATLWDPYMLPEIAFADDLRQRVSIPEKVNINHGSLNELKALPGVNEEIALKVMRGRPFEGIQDFYKKLPGLDKKNIERLIEQVQPKILFK